MVGLIKEEEGKFGVAAMIDVIRPIVERWVGALVSSESGSESPQ
jgi:hypothetical protein